MKQLVRNRIVHVLEIRAPKHRVQVTTLAPALLQDMQGQILIKGEGGFWYKQKKYYGTLLRRTSVIGGCWMGLLLRRMGSRLLL